MCKRNYNFEDFVLDPEFQKWVLSPDASSKAYWDSYLKKNPHKYKDIVMAREMVLNISRKSHDVKERVEANWQRIEQSINKLELGHPEKKVVPIDALSTLRQHKEPYRAYRRHHQLYRWAGILVIAFMLSILANQFLQQDSPQVVEVPVTYEEHYAPPGVKSNLTLRDGSKVILNSGSRLRYVKNFESHQRMLELEGEGYFEVAKDPNRPFKVKTESVTTTALGTSFTIKAYKNETLDISLLTGLVAIQVEMEQPQQVQLEKGEALQVDLNKSKVFKTRFDEKKRMAWTQRTILFEQTPIEEAIRVLENWYGVKIEVRNKPVKGVLLSGKFVDQTLKRVLEGLSYSARFEFQIAKDRVTLTFDSSL